MNFCDKMILRFRKQGLSENEIFIKLTKYYFYSKVALVIFVFTFILLFLRARFGIIFYLVCSMYYVVFTIKKLC